MGLALAFVGATTVLLRLYGGDNDWQWPWYSLEPLGWALALVAALILVRTFGTLYVRAARPGRCVPAAISSYLSIERIVGVFIVACSYSLFMAAFARAKSLIPRMHPFCWDTALAEADAILHTEAPWRLLDPLLGHPAPTLALCWVYALWFPVMAITVAWQVLDFRCVRLRMQYFLTQVLCWSVLGIVGATVFSSAGPCYYDRLYPGQDEFAGLRERLHEMATTPRAAAVTEAQDRLWRQYLDGDTRSALSISAMPSMHVSMALLCALVGRRVNRWLGVAYWLFIVLTMVSCVYLGWHYAVDGYAAILGTWLIWTAVGRLPSG
jgi:membrane-associated phospholipid phosphatase